MAADAAPGDRDERIYDVYTAGLYRQALMTLDDPGLAEQVVSDVLVHECVRSPLPAAGAGDTGRRLAVSAYWRYQGWPLGKIGAIIRPGGGCPRTGLAARNCPG